MDKSQLYWVFLDFIGGDSIEIEGLYLKPERILRDGNTIEFSIQNPNDISFYTEVLVGYLEEILSDFSKFTNHKFKIHIDNNYPVLYFNKKLKIDIANTLKSIKTLIVVEELNGVEYRFEIKGRSVGYDTEYDLDNVVIWNEFSPKSGMVYNNTTNKVVTTDLDACIQHYKNIIKSTSRYLESDKVYQKLDTVLDEYPLISESWIVQTYHTAFKV
jgi:hypothetical protein